MRYPLPLTHSIASSPLLAKLWLVTLCILRNGSRGNVIDKNQPQ